MSSITFTQGANVCTVDASVVYGTDFWDRRLNQFSLRTADGGTTVVDNGPTEVHGTLVLKNMSYTDGNNLRTWLRTYALFEKNTFTISAITAVDLGLGKNTQLTLVRYDGGNTDEGVFKYIAPGFYDATIPYRFLRS